MSRLTTFVSAIVFSSLTLTVVAGCSSNVEESEEVVAPSEPSVAPQAISTGGTDGTGTTTTGTVERPKCDQRCMYDGCMSSCRKDHLSIGWCDSYCFCRAVALGGYNECAKVASESFIDN